MSGHTDRFGALHRAGRGRWQSLGLAATLALLSTGCDLDAVVTDAEADLLVVEGLVHVQRTDQDDLGGSVAGSQLQVLLHRTVRSDGRFVSNEPGAVVEVAFADGTATRLEERPAASCASGSELVSGTCYELADPEAPESPLARLAGGETLTLNVETSSGEQVTGTTRIPGSFDLISVRAGSPCLAAPERTMPVRWTASSNAWAYIAETQIHGLRAALADRSVDPLSDPLFLVGVSLGSADTETVFPSEFGLFDRPGMDPALAEVLQSGLPGGTSARVSISAVDANYVGWVRSSFHPSGRVRVPSVTGDGTGFFGSAVSHWFDIAVDDPGLSGSRVDPTTGQSMEACPTME